jgi:hypothetical protein
MSQKQFPSHDHNFDPGSPISGQAIKNYVDDQMDQSLNYKQVQIDAKEITMSFDTPTSEMLLDKMSKKTLEIFQEHLQELLLYVEKRLFEKS